ncbi:MAG: bifunctional hydroxymethylpyrimidine kinase/phosphomethylpyrimidine kinase [Firmicutes bacterium]|nr:bifunctional hydroxymethylpyrimidine kinase/phosphomethylpyrimidine kinase [Bacillota bacterium]
MEIKKVIAIGGSDPSGGAGIQADIKTFIELGIYPYTALAAVTAQNSQGVRSYKVLTAKFLRDQLEAIIADGKVHGVKTGMLGSSENIMEIAYLVSEKMIENTVIDPVIKSNDGKMLISEAAISVLKKRLLPYCLMVTPNINEAGWLTGIKISSEDDFLRAAQAIKETGVEWVLIKGGHFEGDRALDLLYDGNNEYYFDAKKIKVGNVRGTGCMLASAICAYLVKGLKVYDAVDKAKAYVYNKIIKSVQLGKGSLQALH